MSSYLVHHGIKGQKWGVRRFQNDDGTLTTAGLERYGGKKEYGDSGLRRLLTGRRTAVKIETADGGKGRLTIGANEARANLYAHKQNKYEFKKQRAENKAKEARNDKEMIDLGWGEEAEAYARDQDRKAAKYAKKAERLSRKREAFTKLSADRIAYDNHTSTGKMFAQNFAFYGVGGEAYRNARSMGYNRGRSFVSAMFFGADTEKLALKKYGG